MKGLMSNQEWVFERDENLDRRASIWYNKDSNETKWGGPLTRPPRKWMYRVLLTCQNPIIWTWTTWRGVRHQHEWRMYYPRPLNHARIVNAILSTGIKFDWVITDKNPRGDDEELDRYGKKTNHHDTVTMIPHCPKESRIRDHPWYGGGHGSRG